MFWVVIVGVLALGGLAVVVGYGYWLAHKAADLASEVGVLGQRADELLDLLGQIKLWEPALGPDPAHNPRTVHARPGDTVDA
ncbi:MAG TPA: hypothetical protein VFP89_08200 [Propionibacteriaceae bacterium]|nr:hypothetical protein [Propionibacteriaceae bacterium]